MKDCRVIDLGIITAGAATSAILADLGAEVIKIESPSYRDAFRDWVTAPPAGTPAGTPSPFFNMTNRGKASASIDFKRPEGREAFLRLVANSHVVVENFRRGVLDKLGIGFDVLRQANPDIILASISSQGETGPDAGYISFGSTLEAMGGLAAITGYPGGPPVASGVEVNYPDQVVSVFASSMVVTAWLSRGQRSGGVHLDLSQRELTTFLISEAFASDRPATRLGNAVAGIAVQDCYRAADGAWLAVTVEPGKTRGLAGRIDAPPMSNSAAVEAALAHWISARPAGVAASALREIGIAAAVVLDGKGVMATQGRSWGMAMRRLADGALVKGHVFADEAAPARIGGAAPPLGTNTRDVLMRVAGYSDAQVRELARDGIIETLD